MSRVTHQNLIGYISAISKPIHFWFHRNYLLFKGYKVSYNRKYPHFRSNFDILNLNLKIGEGAPPLLRRGLDPHLTQTRLG